MIIEPATTQQLAAALAKRGDDGLTALLAARPDLANPAPSSMTALAARAASRPSVERALREMNAAELAAARALTEGRPPTNGVAAGTAESIQAPGDGEVAQRLSDLALALDGRPVTGLIEAAQTPASPPEVLTGEPPATAYRTVPLDQAADEGVRAAAETVRLVTALLEFWEEEGASILRTGGVGVREIRRTAAALQITEPHCAFIAELAATAGLLGQDEDPAAWVPARQSRDWLDDPLPQRWAALVSTWPDSARVAWLAGTREDGAMRAALQPELERGWAVTLRRRVLDLLAALPEGAAPGAETVHALLAWERPRATPAQPHVHAVLEEAARLGVTGAGALTPLGRSLHALHTEHAPSGARELALIAALEEALPEPVEDLLIQSDLTGVVPGWPAAELGALLERCGEVESRGSALTVRFTPASIRGGLDAGLDAEGLVTALKRYSRTPLPQALEYLVHDTARRHGQVRVGTARSYLLAADTGTADQLIADPALRALKLRRLGEKVVLSPVEPTQVLNALRSAGLAPVAEGADGEVMALTTSRRLLPPAARPGASTGTYSRRLNTQELVKIAARARAGEEQRHRDIARHSDTGPMVTDPVHALEVLRAAAASGETVELVLVGSLGRSERRRVRPLSVEGGRVRVADVEREVELVVAVHRISEVIAVE